MCQSTMTEVKSQRSAYIDHCPDGLPDAILSRLSQGSVAAPQSRLCRLLTDHLRLDLLVCLSSLLSIDE